jgi:hypothetical protein
VIKKNGETCPTCIFQGLSKHEHNFPVSFKLLFLVLIFKIFLLFRFLSLFNRLLFFLLFLCFLRWGLLFLFSYGFFFNLFLFWCLLFTTLLFREVEL